MQNAIKFMVHGKRTRLIPSDVDNSLILNNIEVYFIYFSFVDLNGLLIPVLVAPIWI